MSAGEIAGLIAAVAFVLLVGVLAVPLIKLGGVLDETRGMIKGVADETVPLLNEVTTNVSALTAVFAATLGSPVIKVAAFSYGVRSALAGRNRSRVEKQVRDQLKAERRARRGKAS